MLRQATQILRPGFRMLPKRCFSTTNQQYERFLKRTGSNSETYVFGSEKSKVLITCEHASCALPSGYSWSAEDLERDLNTDHWAYDPGAAEFSLEIGQQLKCPVVLSKYSRLFVDVNRPLGSPTLMRNLCDGQVVGLNKELSSAEKLKRISSFYVPYHLELGEVAEEHESELIVSVHSYTKNYEGSERKVQVGILYSTESSLAEKMVTTLSKGSFPETEINQPWSGKDGFMFSCDSVAHSSPTPGARKSVMLEMRNDKLVDPQWRAKLIAEMVDDITNAVQI
mmetsp:Transcript_5406/g.6533  ORF Transcript_5406/g.6533 Transcript_5406/m.6533 type:complete len:282 (+) Transcript_5406:56-901(+)